MVIFICVCMVQCLSMCGWSFLSVQGTKDETEKEDESEKPETSAAAPSQQPPPPAQGKVPPLNLH